MFSKSFIHNILHIFFIYWYLSSFGITLFFFLKMPSFIKRGVGFQMLRCIFVPDLCITLWKLAQCGCSWHIVICLLTDTPKFHRIYGFNSMPLRPLASFSSSAVTLKIRNQLLWQIITCQLDKTVNNIAQWNQNVKPKTVNQLYLS